MRVHLIKKDTIEVFARQNGQSRLALKAWLAIVKNAVWDKPADIQQSFRSADLLGRNSNRVVFNIAGNQYRLICKYTFGAIQAHLFVCWIGTHANYDKICAANQQYFINIY